MSNKKFVVFLSLLAILGMVLSACGPKATETPVATEAPAARGWFDLRDCPVSRQPVLWLGAGDCSGEGRRAWLYHSETRP